MAQKKKLQVFVSSTYTDLHEERQAAVQAVLTAGHIPAGMELFAAGDETQMNVIKHWIDDSDVYMLILGGRYGSIESKSQKSYIHLEYEYAVEKGKPLFAVVIDESYLEEKVKKEGLRAIEKDHSEKLKEFRELVCSRMVRFWKDPKDIKLAVMETMADFSSRAELIGWIPGNEAVNAGAIADELARLTKENAELRAQISAIPTELTKYNGLSFDEMYHVLSARKLIGDSISTSVLETMNFFGDSEANLLHYLVRKKSSFARGLKSPYWERWEQELIEVLTEVGLLVITREPSTSREIASLTNAGQQFLLRLRIQKNLD